MNDMKLCFKQMKIITVYTQLKQLRNKALKIFFRPYFSTA